MRPQLDIRAVDQRVAAVAEVQWGVLAYRQLLAAGLSASAVRNRVRSGRLRRLHRGVYALGHTALAPEGFWMGAVLAGGKGTALSHLQAAGLWRMLGPDPGPIHITVPTSGGRAQRRGLVIHRAALPPSQTTIRARIPVTRPERTLADLRRIVPAETYRRALRQAEYLELPFEVETDGTRSELEALFLGLCRRHHLPRPEVNAQVGPFTIDFLWRAERVAVELDGYRAHSGRQAFEDDRERDAWLALRGYQVIRFTHRQVTREAALVARTLSELLARTRGR